VPIIEVFTSHIHTSRRTPQHE